jgi:hypothetical protein
MESALRYPLGSRPVSLDQFSFRDGLSNESQFGKYLCGRDEVLHRVNSAFGKRSDLSENLQAATRQHKHREFGSRIAPAAQFLRHPAVHGLHSIEKWQVKES